MWVLLYEDENVPTVHLDKDLEASCISLGEFIYLLVKRG